MISAILVFGQRGEVLSSRVYKDGLRRAITDVFRVQVISNPEAKSPLLTLGSTSFLHIRHEDLYIVAVTRHDVDAALVYELLYKIVDLSTSYLGAFNEQTVSKNVTMVYELLDEIVDFGYPQNTDRDTLRQFISRPSTSTGPVSIMRSRQNSAPDAITAQATSATSWRRTGIKYRRNEVFLDINEKVNIVLGPHDTVIQSDVNGQIMVKSHLSGMPRCHIGLNDNPNGHEESEDKTLGLGNKGVAHLEDFQLHQCVELERFNTTHDISFIPPDGTFELMRYRAARDIKLPFRVHASVVEQGKTRVDYEVTVKATFESKLGAQNIVVRVPVPPNAAKTSPKVGNGRVKYIAGKNMFEWKMNRMSGGSEVKLTGSAELTPTSSNASWSRPPISMEFSLNMYSSSGLNVRYLKIVENSNYSTLKWVRYLVEAGSYEVRI